MGKKESKIFRDRLKGKDGTRQRSEEEILLTLYPVDEIKKAEDRMVNKQIAKRNKEFAKKGILIPQSPGKERDYRYFKIIPGDEELEDIEISEEQFNDPNFLGLKKKCMVSVYKKEDGSERLITVQTVGKFTPEEKEGCKRLKNLKQMQESFEKDI